MASVNEDGSSVANFSACHGAGLSSDGSNFQASGASVYDGSYHDTSMDTPNHRVGVVVLNKGFANYFDGKVRHLGLDGARDGWQGSCGGSNEVYLSEVNNGVGTDRVATTATWASGDTLWTEADGDDFRCWFNSGSDVANYTSSLYNTQVRVGMGIYGDGANRIGNFEAADLGGAVENAGPLTARARLKSLVGGSLCS